MTPSVEHRLDSVVRALTDIIMPALPREAGLASEQARLAVGHLMILKQQMPALAAFEAEELADARALGAALAGVAQGGTATTAAAAKMRAALDAPANGRGPSLIAEDINAASSELLQAAFADGAADFKRQIREITLRYEAARAAKDRKWFAPMGFDAEITA